MSHISRLQELGEVVILKEVMQPRSGPVVRVVAATDVGPLFMSNACFLPFFLI
jgi:hypothetical protein